MRFHHTGNDIKTVLQILITRPLKFQIPENFFIRNIHKLTLFKVGVLFAQTRDQDLEHTISTLKRISANTLKRQKYCWLLVPPFGAQFLIFSYQKPLKIRSAIPFNVKEIFQHRHTKRLAEPPWPRNQTNLKGLG